MHLGIENTSSNRASKSKYGRHRADICGRNSAAFFCAPARRGWQHPGARHLCTEDSDLASSKELEETVDDAAVADDLAVASRAETARAKLSVPKI